MSKYHSNLAMWTVWRNRLLKKGRGFYKRHAWVFAHPLSRYSNYLARSFYLTNKEASTVVCSVVKHTGNGRARKPKYRGKLESQSSVFPYFLSSLKQNRAQWRLLYFFYDKESNNFPKHSLNFQTKPYFPKEWKWRQPCTVLWYGTLNKPIAILVRIVQNNLID